MEVNLPAAHYFRFRLNWCIACTYLFVGASFIAPVISGFQATNFHQHQRLHSKKLFIPRANNLYIRNMNESESNHPPANKKFRPSPPLSGTTMKKSTEPGTIMTQPPGTFYITVGPQCSGKTTILKQIFGKSFHKNEEAVSESVAGVDITIDDQPLVYIPVPINYFLRSSTSNTAPDNKYLPLNQAVLGKSINERILDPSNEELTLVLQRLAGNLGAGDFALRLKGNNKKGGNTGGTKSAQEDLIDAVEDVIQLQTVTGKEGNDKTVTAILPETIDLFIVESIFRPRPLKLIQRVLNNERSANQNNTSASSSETKSALDQAHHLIKTYAMNPLSAPLSWGNTNTRPREFQTALEAAASSGRPVEFIVFGGNEACEMIREHMSKREYRKMSHENGEHSAAGPKDDETIIAEENVIGSEEQALLCLPKVDRKTLFVRNLQRLLVTGRYIPSTAIVDAIVRVESMLANAAAEANKERPNEENNREKESKNSMSSAKFKLDYELAKLAGYRLNVNRTVSSINPRHGNTRGNRNNQSGRNNYQSGRGDNRNRQRPGNYDGRGRNYGGRGGRSSSRQENNSNYSRQDHQNRTYDNSGRSYDQSQRRESGSYHPRTENGGVRNSYNPSQRSEQSNGGETNGRGWNDRQYQDRGQWRGNN